MGVVLRVAEEPSTTEILIEELAIVDAKTRQFPGFFAKCLNRPILRNAHIVAKPLRVVAVADGCRNLALRSAHHVTTEVFVFKALLKGIGRDDA